VEIVERKLAVWDVLDDNERKVLEAASDWLLRHKHWEAAHGFALVDEITVTIAAPTERRRAVESEVQHVDLVRELV